MSSNYELLCQAASDGDVELVEFLLNDGKVDPNPSVPTQESALSIACRNKNLDIVRMLVTNQQHPADPNKPDSKEYTPLWLLLPHEIWTWLNFYSVNPLLK